MYVIKEKLENDNFIEIILTEKEADAVKEGQIISECLIIEEEIFKIGVRKYFPNEDEEKEMHERWLQK